MFRPLDLGNRLKQNWLGPTFIRTGLVMRQAANRLTTAVIMTQYRAKMPAAGYTLSGMLDAVEPADFGKPGQTMFFAMPGCEEVVDNFLIGSGYQRSGIEVKQFRNGESYARIGETVRGRTAIICQDFSGPGLNDRLVQTLLAIDAAKRADAKVVLIVPQLPYINDRPGSANCRIDYLKLVLNLFFKAANLDELRVGGVTINRQLNLMFLQDKVFSREIAPFLITRGRAWRKDGERPGANELTYLVGKSFRRQGEEIIDQLKKRYQLQGEQLDLGLVQTAPGGQIDCRGREPESLAGKTVYVFQTANTGSINDDIMEALLLVYTARKKRAKDVTLVMPHLPYNRQERKAKPREPISAKVLLNALVEAAGATQIIALDPHAPATQGFVDIPFQYLTAFHLVTEYIRELIGGGRLSAGFVPASPDAGRGKLARRLGKEVSGPGADFVVVDKDRPMAGESAVATVIGKVRERDVIIYDDLVDSGGTLRNAALALKGRGAKGIYVVAIHGVFSPVVINSPEELATIRQFLTSQGKRIEDYVKSGPDGPIVNALIRLQADPNIDGIIFTDSLSVPEQNIIDRLKTVIIPVSPVLATACGRIIQGGSLVGYQYEGW